MFERRYFVLAPDYHGATLLAKLVNAHPDVAALGDTYPTRRYDQICGCGVRVSSCPFWNTVRSRLDVDRHPRRSHWLESYPRILGAPIDRALLHALPPSLVRRCLPRSKGAAFLDEYERFLVAVSELEEHGSPVVFVDGVKSIGRVIAMHAAGGRVDGVLHLVRDPGDFVKSSMRNKGERLGVLIRSALEWRAYHARARRLRSRVSYLRVSYEALSEHTDAILADVFAFLEVPPRTVEQLRATLDLRWHYMGNASLRRFDGRIRRSTHELAAFERRVVGWITGVRRPAS